MFITSAYLQSREQSNINRQQIAGSGAQFFALAQLTMIPGATMASATPNTAWLAIRKNSVHQVRAGFFS
jgi:hypothetical protein